MEKVETPLIENWFIKNCTPHRLKIHGTGNTVLELSPLEKGRIISKDDINIFNLEKLSKENKVYLEKQSEINKFEWVGPTIFTAAIFFFIIGSYISHCVFNPPDTHNFFIVVTL